ncbi:MAG: ribbon-helix-helix protein, CopG family, partial [Methanoregula sp.]|nr:ribbon-helix-helix protein, CopG family [Methanoregula sp.]
MNDPTNQEDDLSRVGISLPKSLLDKFDELLDLRGYSSRSEGIRDAIRTYITYYQWMADVKGERKGIVSIVYNHEQRGLLETITEIQHGYLPL